MTYPETEGTNSSNYYSDLINSYAWDTAIVFIQAYDDNSYANKNNSEAESTTGTNPDKLCNIHDMSGNKLEWSTEISMCSDTNNRPITERGGFYGDSYGGVMSYTYTRFSLGIAYKDSYISFRVILCIK